MVGTHVGHDVSADEKARALDDVLHSTMFARSERLKGLLRYLCEAEMQGRESDLTEYIIATSALGRPPDFSPLEDSSVRSRVYELRQRLDKFYAEEAPHAQLRIQLPKGSYVPRFLPFQPDEAPTLQPTALTPAPKSTRPLPLPLAIAFASGAALMFAILALWSALSHPGARLPATHLESTAASPWTSELEAFWHPFTTGGTPLLIAFETRFFVRMGDLMVRDWRVNGPDGIEDSQGLVKLMKLFDFRYYGNREYSDGGTPQALFYLTRLLSARIPNLTVKNSLDVTAADLRDNNVILLGKPGMEQQADRVLSHSDLIDMSGKIVNVHPLPGEQSEYADQSDPKDPTRWGRKYSVVTMMPGATPNKRILALTASGAEQPASLAYFVTNPDSVRELFRRASPVPDFFQVLTRAEYKARSVVKVEYVTHRILKTHP